MEHIKKHFEEEANEFDGIILKLIPYYSQMLDALVDVIPFETNASIKVIDLGCGTGTIAKMIKKVFPNSSITCLDLAANMIEVCKQKMKDYPNTSYEVADLQSYDFKNKYDVAVSSLALHHLITDEHKKIFYRKVFNSLNSGGVFYNADIVLASSAHLQQMYMEKWKEFMRKSLTEDEIENKWMITYREEDNPSKLVAQLEWLKAIGFSEVDTIWKYFNFALYGGRKM
jgi:tRNA (cmo5U34)-methyltransferase